MTESSPRPDAARLLAEMGWLRGLAGSLAADPELAQDLEQETWLAALQHPPQVDLGPVARRGWLATVLRNAARRTHRAERARARREAERAHPEGTPPADESYERLVLQRRLVEAVLALEEPYRSAVTLRFLDDLPPRVIARRQGISAAAARQRISRGLAMLRARLDAEYGGERGTWGSVALLFTARDAGPIAGGPPTSLDLMGGITMSAKLWIAAGVAFMALGLTWLATREGAAAASETPGRTAVLPAHPTLDPAPEQEEAADGSHPRLFAARTPVASERADSFAIDRDRDLHGVVIDPDGNAVPGAHLRILRQEASDLPSMDVAYLQDVRTVAELESDSLGRFAVPLDAGIPFHLLAEAEGFAAAPVSYCSAGERLVVRLHPSAKLAGRVIRGAGGKGIDGARIRAFSGEALYVDDLVVVTNSEGSFLLDGLAPGRLLIEVAGGGTERCDFRRIEIEAGKEHELEIVLAEGFFLTVQVIDATTGAPIPGAEVGHSWTMNTMAATDANGTFTFERFPEDGTLCVRAAGYGRTSRLLTGILEKRRRGAFVDVELLPAIPVRGRVVDADGEPLAAIHVAALAKAWETLRPLTDVVSTRTGRDGTFLLGEVRPDLPHAIVLRKEGFGTRVYEFPQEGPEVDLGDIVLHPAGLVRGVALDFAGRPIADHWIRLDGANLDRESRFATQRIGDLRRNVAHRDMRTDDIGRFAFGNLSDGLYTVSAMHAGLRRDVRVRVHDGEFVDVRLDFVAGVTIEGLVVGPDGRGVTGIPVCVMPTGMNPANRRNTETDEDGSFLLDDVRPGTYRVHAWPRNEAPPGKEGVRFAYAIVHDVQPGERGIVIELEHAEAVHGVVLDPDGEPVAGIIVQDEEGFYGGSVTEADGRFELWIPEGESVDILASPFGNVRLPDGRYPNPEARARAKNVRPGDEDLVLTLGAHP